MSLHLKVITLGLASCLVLVGTAQATDHLDSRLVQTDGRLDINDIHAFQSPTNQNNTVLIMTVNPAAGVFSPTSLEIPSRTLGGPNIGV